MSAPEQLPSREPRGKPVSSLLPPGALHAPAELPQAGGLFSAGSPLFTVTGFRLRSTAAQAPWTDGGISKPSLHTVEGHPALKGL